MLPLLKKAFKCQVFFCKKGKIKHSKIQLVQPSENEINRIIYSSY